MDRTHQRRVRQQLRRSQCIERVLVAYVLVHLSGTGMLTSRPSNTLFLCFCAGTSDVTLYIKACRANNVRQPDIFRKPWVSGCDDTKSLMLVNLASVWLMCFLF